MTVLNAVKASNENKLIIPQDIYNYRKQWRIQQLNGLFPLQALLQKLHDTEYFYRYRKNDANQITGLFWAHPVSIQLLRAFPHVLLMDCTYKTNKFKMPLLNVIGITSTFKTFNVCFCFMTAETEEQYMWAVEQLKVLLHERMPTVVATDREIALMNAVRNVFPSTKNVLCRWHIQKNVLAKCKRNFLDQEQWDKFNGIWNLVMNSKTEEDFNENWELLVTTFAQYGESVQYLQNTWLPYKEHFVSAWTNRYFHMGTVVTSRVESSHAALKKWLGASTGDLWDVVTKISQELVNQDHNRYAEIEVQRIRIQHHFRIPFLQNVLGNVSFHALTLIKKQHDDAVRHGRSALPQVGCTGEFTRTMGLPCEHLIATWLLSDRKVELNDIHPQWWLCSRNSTPQVLNIPISSLHPPIVDLEVRNPAVQRTRGRPTGARNRSGVNGTRRDPSVFEHVLNDGNVGGRACSICRGQGHNRRRCPQRRNHASRS